jgi:hypothetical protein
MRIPDLSNLSGAQFKEIHFKLHYPEFYEFIINKYNNENITFKEMLYWYFNNITERPKCILCGKDVIFENCKTGYRKYCSTKCLNSDPEKIEKTKQVIIKKYGGNAPACSKDVVNKMKATSLKRYGVENAQQNIEIKNRTKNTILERYGGIGNASNILKEKYVNTCLERYNVTNSAKSENVREKISKSKRKSVIINHPHIIEYIDNTNLLCKCKCPHTDCNKCDEKFYIIDSTILANRISHNIELCTKLLPINPQTSTYELKLHDILNEYNIEYATGNRKIISKELDIYIPSKNIAIEFNGVYHHSEEIKSNNYHINTWQECKYRNIQLLTIWQDQYETKLEIVKSLILNKLGLCKTKIYARKCVLKTVSPKDASNFYENNHIQGKAGATIHYGLYYNDELVSMMSFGKRAIGKYNNWELIRYCCKLNTIVVGGTSKLFKKFITEYNPKTIISWSSNDISNGEMYKLLGFIENTVSTSYWYISKKDFKRYHRSAFSKQNLIKKGIVTESDNRSENEIMKELPYYKIWDTGQTKWIWNTK